MFTALINSASRSPSGSVYGVTFVFFPAAVSSAVLTPTPSMLKAATIRSPRAFAFSAAVTLVQGVCSSLQKRNLIVRSDL